jgi:hypothetical protein
MVVRAILIRSCLNFSLSALARLGKKKRTRTREDRAPIIDSTLLQCLERGLAGDSVALHDGLRVDLARDKLLRLAQELAGEHAHAGRPVPNLVVLHFGDVDEDLRGGVVELDRLEDRRAVVGDADLACRRRLQDLVHPLRTERRLDDVADGHGPDKTRQACRLRAFLRCLRQRKRKERSLATGAGICHLFTEDVHRHRKRKDESQAGR